MIVTEERIWTMIAYSWLNRPIMFQKDMRDIAAGKLADIWIQRPDVSHVRGVREGTYDSKIFRDERTF